MSAEYTRYLERLRAILYHEVVPKMAVFDYFTNHIYARDKDPDAVEPLMWFIQSALYSDITFSLFRLIDTESGRNIADFLTHAADNLSTIPWKNPMSLAEIEEQRGSLGALKQQLKNLKARRNKFFGHCDSEFFYEPDKLDAVFPFSTEDAKTLIRTLQKIIAAHMWALNGTLPISFDGVAYLAAERLYEKLRSQHNNG